MAKKLKVGIIGTGGIAQAHLAAWDRCADVEIAALCDVRPEALTTGAEKWQVAADHCFSDFKVMLDNADLDIVDVCTPNSAHVGPTVAALKAGRHVIVEKPAGTSAREVERMVQAGTESGKLLMVAQVMRFSSEGQLCKHWIRQGLVGDIYWGRAEYLRPRGVPAWGAFINQEASGGGPCYDIGVHVLDMALHLMDFPEPETVSAGTYLKLANKPSVMKHDPKKYTVPEDFAVALVRFADGRTLSLGASWALNLREEIRQVLVCGEKGSASLWPPTLVTESEGVMATTTPQVTVFDGADAFYNECSAFAAAIRSGGPSPVPGEQALITQRILDAVYKSGAKGREVRV
ncbi:MAG TPA: Gfo/Idh/MocA family oxidoreductase [Armatimonadota bacterium]|jgi:predicted dehydrogenase